MTNIPVRTAVKLRGDHWALGLDVHDPRGHRTNIVGDYGFSEFSATRLYFAMRRNGKSPAEACRIVEACAGS